MTVEAGRSVVLDQLWYGWSQTTWSGLRGYGVVAASSGWEEHLRAGEDFLGPVVAFPDWAGGREPPASGGLAVLRGIPTVFWRVPVATDGLGRPGSYAVRLAASWQRPLDALDAVRLLNAGALEGPPPSDDQRHLDPLTLTLDPPAAPEDGRPVVLLAALLDGLREGRQVVVSVPDEPTARRVLEPALALVPAPLRTGWSFSSMESAAEPVPFDLVFRVEGWPPDGRGSRRPVDVDLVTGGTGALQPDVLRWAEQLAAAAPPWRPGEEPGDVTALGRVLDAVHRSRHAPQALSAADIAVLAHTSAVAEWARSPGAQAAAAQALRGGSSREIEDLVDTAGHEPTLGNLLEDAAWRVLESDGDGSPGVRNAEALLVGCGVPQEDVDLARVRRLPSTARAYGLEDSRRILRTLARRSGDLDARDWALLGCLAWDADARAGRPTLWLQTVMTSPSYLGQTLSRDEVSRLPRGAVRTALTRAVTAGVDPVDAGRRIAAVLPKAANERAALLVQLADTEGPGVTATFLGALTAPEATDADRAAVLRHRWPAFVDEAGLPAYLATALEARAAPGSPLRLSRRGLLVLVLLVLAVAAAVTLSLLTWLR